ncbi:MAG: four helix bundle protein [Candidatus Berkelbacteria bacterium]|nr:four helix bundle protein [Candidatus Berkelbacteria bacterium]
MNTSMKSFQDIIAWQKSHEFVLKIYELTKLFPKNEEFCLTNQIRRAAISVPSNIAEGFKRKSTKDSLHFYNIAEGSLEEAKYQLLLARDLGYIESLIYEKVCGIAAESSKLLCRWIKSQSARLNS